MTGKKYDVENLGHTVKMLRINRKISQILLAEKLGISQTYLSNLEHGRGIFSLKMLVTIAEIFDISMDELLSELVNNKSREYDFIILDPPAFTKSGSTVKNAIRGYKEINLKAMKLLPRGGYLATCSCSHFMKEELFVQMLHDAAADANVQLRQIEARQQSPDHPILWNVPETYYLKFYIFQVV